jgi:hypothetical protein
MSPDERVALVAESQYGLLTYSQAIECGLTEKMIKQRLASGRWTRLHEGVYRVNGAPQSWNQRMCAAVLAAGPGAVASHRAAARLWDLDGFAKMPRELSVMRDRRPRLARTIVHCSTDLDRSLTTTRLGIPVTSPARTILDLGAVVRRWHVERAMACAIGRRLVQYSDLAVELGRHGRRGRRGAGVLRSLLDERGFAPVEHESHLEGVLLRLVRVYDLPVPICQFEVFVGGQFVGRVDFAYPEYRVLIEVDGYEHHSSLDAFQGDRVRQNDLVEAGWIVLRFTWEDLVHRPAEVAARILRVLATVKARSGA